MCTRPCQDSCDICNEISATAESDWCFQWLYDLKHWEDVDFLSEVENQIGIWTLKDPEEQIAKIRHKLASLQMKTPAWLLIDKIAGAASKKSMKVSWEMQQEKLFSACADKEDVCTCPSCQPKANSSNKSSKVAVKQLQKFVKIHIEFMLKKLYEKIETVEKKMSTEEFEEDLKQVYNISDSGQNFKVFGPVGERPLHVCCLSAHRFTAIDFEGEGEGKFVNRGIQKGVMKYLRGLPTSPGAVEVANEIHSGYWKDYCAAVVRFIVRHKNKALHSLPFWKFLENWEFNFQKWKTSAELSLARSRRKSLSRAPMCPPMDDSSSWLFISSAHEKHQFIRDRELIVHNGLFEGENILFPIIAGGDVRMIYQLLSLDSRLLNANVKGLFFRPMYRNRLNSYSFWKGWRFYRETRLYEKNTEASSNMSYFGLNVLSFAASQGDTGVFDVVLNKIEECVLTNLNVNDEPKNRAKIQKAVVNIKDEFGNTALHLAAWNGKVKMFDHLVKLGADMSSENCDGLTPFTLTARFGIWDLFDHVWNVHLSKTAWMFGNVEKRILDQKELDFKCLKFFGSRRDAKLCLEVLLETYEEIVKDSERSQIESYLGDTDLLQSENLDYAKQVRVVLGIEDVINPGLKETNRKDPASVIALITLFRPAGWYKNTKDKIEHVILAKWEHGYRLIHLGLSVVPYFVILILFGFMWMYRRLSVLDHKFWWAQPEAVSALYSMNASFKVMSNPVRADVAELEDILKTELLGTDPASLGLLPEPTLSADSGCGWKSIVKSRSGALQFALILYSVPTMLRLAYSQRRTRPSDLDENEDMKLSMDEIINFIYFNLESLLHLVLTGLFVGIFVYRVRAGDDCKTEYIQWEKRLTSIAALFLFLNLFVMCKPFKGIGVLVLTMYKIMMEDIFSFLVMYSIFFTAFLLAIQNIHNSNLAFLSWLDHTSIVVPQITALTGNSTYLMNANIPSNAAQLRQTYMALAGCERKKMSWMVTGFSLLEISFGDGLADALEQARDSDFECAGFAADSLVGYLLVFWVFLTNILVLNMLIAMMNSTFERQRQEVHSVWLLDISYRIIRFEYWFPNLSCEIKLQRKNLSFWNVQDWESFRDDAKLVLSSLQEVRFIFFVISHLKGLSCFQKKSNVWNEGNEGLFLKKFKENLAKNLKCNPQDQICCALLGMKPQSLKGRYDHILKELTNFRRQLFVEKHIKNLCATSDPTRPVEKASLVCVSLIYQLKLFLKMFDESRAVPKIIERSSLTSSDKHTRTEKSRAAIL